MKLQRLNALLFGCFALLANPAAAVDYSSPSLTIDVYAGGISSNEIAKKQLWMMIQGLQTGAPATLLPNLIHIEHSLKRPFALAEGAKSADGQKIDIAAHVESDQASGKVKIAFSKLGWSPGYAGATELLIGPNEHRVLRLPVVQEGDGEQKETIVAISTGTGKTHKDGHSRFEVGGI
jgi:hypothetical protein